MNKSDIGRVMKLLFICILMGLMHVSAASKAQTITLKGSGLAFAEVITAIRQQTGFEVYVMKDHLNHTRKLTIDVKDMPLDKFLTLVLTDQPLEAKIIDKTIMFSSKKGVAAQREPAVSLIVQPHRIEGVVVDEEQRPMEGVSVLFRAEPESVLKVMAITDNNGRFSVVLPALPAVLVFNYLGYHEQQISVDRERNLRVVLATAIEDLDEVVVVGYGTIAKSDYTGSSSRVNLQSVGENRYVSGLEAMQGRLAGVQITNSSGEPGSGTSFNIRGRTSISGSGRPLIVVDGQPIESSLSASHADHNMAGNMDISANDPLASINPADIESIEVLKDASSTAIYGSRGANGVVMITTKSGKSGKDKVNFSSRMDYNTVPKYIDVLGSREYMEFVNEGRINSGLEPAFTSAQMDSIVQTTNVNWQKLVLQNNFSHDQLAQLSGRDDHNNYLISGNVSNQQSLIKNAGFKRYGIRFNYERKISDKLTVSVKSNLSYTDRKFGQQSSRVGTPGQSAVLGSLIFAPINNWVNEEGDLNDALVNNPLVVAERVQDHTALRSLILNGKLDYQLSRFLKYTLMAGVNDMNSLRFVYHPKGTHLGNSGPNGSASRADNMNTTYIIDNLLSYNRKLLDKHQINAVGGFSYQYWDRKASGVTNANFPSDAMGYHNFQSAESPGRMSTRFESRALQSVLGRVNYAYDKRYLLTLTGRADGSSRLGVNNKWGAFWSAGLGWNIAEESFFGGMKQVFSNLKLRGSYGLSGMENVAIGATKANYSINYVSFGAGIQPGFVPGSFENRKLKWEITKQFNAGLDVGWMNDRMNLTFDVYQKETDGLLIDLLLPPTSGFGSYQTNLGSIVNKGLEIEGTAKVLTGLVKLDVGANFSLLRNKVRHVGPLSTIYGTTFLSDGGFTLGQAIHAIIPGKGIPVFLGYKTAGIYQNEAEVAAGPESGSARPGDVKWVDSNNDGRISDADRTVIGNPLPDFTYGFHADLSYKAWSLNIVFIGSQGNQQINLNSWVLNSNNSQGGIGLNAARRAYEGRWQGEGTSNLYPRLVHEPVRLSQRFPDWMVEDASYFRLQSVRLGYTFSLSKTGFATALRAFVSGTNLLTLTKYSGYDPAVDAFGGNMLHSGVDFGTLPQPRTFSAGIELNF